MLARRIQRDIVERGRDVKGILDQFGGFPLSGSFMEATDFYSPCRYLRYVKPSYDNFVYPTAAHADIVCTSPRNNQKERYIYICVCLDCARFEQRSGY